MNMGPCGIVCTICRYYRRGLCEGCIRGDLCPPAKALLSPCPVLRCAAARKIPYCARDCPDFPCVLFERRFPRCWFRINSQQQEVARRDDGVLTNLPLSAFPPVTRQPGQEGLRVFCLGPFRVYRGSEEIEDREWGQGKGPTQKIKAMFAFLLSQNERGARKDTLIDLLWPEQTDYGRASAAFHLTLHYLRRALEPDLKSRAASSYIRHEKTRYCFDPLKPYWLDADAFESYCHRAEECDRHGDVEAAMIYWGTALDLFEGDYMAGIHPNYSENRDQDWCTARRQHLRELRLNALLEMIRYYYNNEEYSLCLKYAREALDTDPCFESVYRLAMQCLIKCGQPDSAIHQYHMCEAELARYEDRGPSEQTKQLYEQLTAGAKNQ